ncbi:MAG TPA: hypothetical protein VF817_01620 [Patescibacteria group bacterium]
MIDTIILSIPQDKIISFDLQNQGVAPWDLQARTHQYDRYVKNPSKKDLQGGQYFPYLTGYSRKNGSVMTAPLIRVQFSAPKLLFLNNLDELEESRLEIIVNTLQDRLLKMGISIEKENLLNASVSVVHYSRNIQLSGGYTSRFIIGELNKVNISKCFDLARAKYLNDGECLYAHTNEQALVIYDKVADLAKGQKRATDKDQSLYQRSLFEELNHKKEILRIEARLESKRKINSLFKNLGFDQNPTLKDVFSVEKSNAVLLNYWERMIEKNSLLLFANSSTPKELLKQICIARPNTKGKSSIYFMGLITLIRDGNGMRELRGILKNHANDRSWYRIAGDITKITKSLQKLRPREWYDQVLTGISQYKPYQNE